MNRVWKWGMLLAIASAAVTARWEALSGAVFAAAGEAVTLLITLTGSMAMWSGLMEILSAAGDLTRLGRLASRLAAPLFGGVRDEEGWQAMGMNLAANMLGLGNAATPAGIRAAERLQQLGEPGLKALAVLLTLNNAGVQLIPATVMALRQAAGSADPGCIWAPSVAGALASAVVGVAVLKLLQWRKGRCGG